jgi:hypothetical protein
MLSITKDGVKYEFVCEAQMYNFINCFIQNKPINTDEIIDELRTHVVEQKRRIEELEQLIEDKDRALSHMKDVIDEERSKNARLVDLEKMFGGDECPAEKGCREYTYYPLSDTQTCSKCNFNGPGFFLREENDMMLCYDCE